MIPFLSSDPPKPHTDVDQIRDLLGLDEHETSLEDASEAAVKEMLSAAKARREKELKKDRNA